MTMEEFEARTRAGVLLLDGATGSNMRAAGMPVGVCVEAWLLEHPEPLLELQRAYAEAGSDVVYAPTFSANRLGLRMHGLEDRLAEMNAGLVALTKRAVAGRALVAGDLTTTGQPLEPVGTLTYQALLEVYREQVAVIAAAGVDLLVAETMLSIDETACGGGAEWRHRPGPIGGGGGRHALRGDGARDRQAQRRHARDGREGLRALRHDARRIRRRHEAPRRRRCDRRRRLLRHHAGVHPPPGRGGGQGGGMTFPPLNA